MVWKRFKDDLTDRVLLREGMGNVQVQALDAVKIGDPADSFV